MKNNNSKKEKQKSISFSHNSKNEEIIIQLPTTAEEVVATAAAVEWKRNENLFAICIKFCRQTTREEKLPVLHYYVLFALVLIEVGGRNFVVFVVIFTENE